MPKVPSKKAPAVSKLDALDSTTLTTLYSQPGHLIRRCQQLAVAIWMEETSAGACDITPVQYAALSAIAANPGVDATRVSGLIGFDRSTLGDVLDRLEGRGWLKRHMTATDRRKKTLWLTDEGRNLFRKVTPKMFHVQEKLMEPLSDADRAHFIDLLRRLVGLHTGQVRYSRENRLADR